MTTQEITEKVYKPIAKSKDNVIRETEKAYKVNVHYSYIGLGYWDSNWNAWVPKSQSYWNETTGELMTTEKIQKSIVRDVELWIKSRW